LTTGRTVNLPTASGIAGRTFIIKDESGAAATHNLTLTPFSLGAVSFTDTNVNTTDNVISLSTFIETGTPITLSTAGTLPSPLLAATTYYVTRALPNDIKLATSESNALAGTAIDITTTGSGTFDISSRHKRLMVLPA
jgi:hypothetical protein